VLALRKTGACSRSQAAAALRIQAAVVPPLRRSQRSSMPITCPRVCTSIGALHTQHSDHAFSRPNSCWQCLLPVICDHLVNHLPSSRAIRGRLWLLARFASPPPLCFGALAMTARDFPAPIYTSGRQFTPHSGPPLLWMQGLAHAYPLSTFPAQTAPSCGGAAQQGTARVCLCKESHRTILSCPSHAAIIPVAVNADSIRYL